MTLEQGIKLFDEISRNNISVITEGKNVNYLQRAFELYGLNYVTPLRGSEHQTGKNDLQTLFNFFLVVPHEKHVVFVWDCDTTKELSSKVKTINKTIPFFFDKNQENSIAKKGIENLFPEDAFEQFTKEVTDTNGNPINTFDTNKKNDFEKFILDRNQEEDFKKFEPLINLLRDLDKSDNS